MKRDIQTYIDRAVGTEGVLRIPSWWMHKILSDLVQYCGSLESSDAGIKEYLESQLNLVGDAVEALDARVTKVESHELFAIVSGLPSEPKENTIYLIPSANGEGNNILTEWVYVNGAWEQFGEFKADVDLSGYVKKEDIAELQQNKEDKTNKVTALSDESTDTQYPSAKCVHDSISSLAEEVASNGVLIEDLQNTKIERENDDYYPKMAVGLADNLAGVDVVDSEINFRRSGGGAISDGVARIESIKGNSLVWNQIASPYAGSTDKYCTKNEDGSISVANTEGLTSSASSQICVRKYNKVGHKVLAMCNHIAGTYDANTNYLYFNNGALYINQPKIETVQVDTLYGSLRVTSAISNLRFRFLMYDLTHMFGSGNEPTTIAEFYARIPMGVDLNAYNEGEVIHMDVQSVESQGVNAWDEEWENGSISAITGEPMDKAGIIRAKNMIPIIYGKTYYNSSLYKIYLRFYDEKKNFLSYWESAAKTTITIPSEARFFKFTVESSTYNHDVCINLSDTSINGKYFPYIKRVEDLSIIRKYFPDGMKSAGTAHDEIRYNKASGKWEKVVRIGEVDMGTLNWVYNAPSEGRPYGYFGGNVNERKNGKSNLLCSRYVFAKANLTVDKSIYGLAASVAIIIVDSSYTDAASFKAAMSGVILYYELAEPIVTELDEEDQYKDPDYQVWNGGTEKANAEGKSAPLAADITYGFNAIGKIKELESLVAQLRAKVGI